MELLTCKIFPKRLVYFYTFNEFMFKNSKNCKKNVKQYYKCLGTVMQMHRIF